MIIRDDPMEIINQCEDVVTPDLPTTVTRKLTPPLTNRNDQLSTKQMDQIILVSYVFFYDTYKIDISISFIRKKAQFLIWWNKHLVNAWKIWDSSFRHQQ
jgi:hypothetical protein